MATDPAGAFDPSDADQFFREEATSADIAFPIKKPLSGLW
jgi:hypothetical protein